MGRWARRLAAVAAVGSLWAPAALAAPPAAAPAHPERPTTTAPSPEVDPSSVLVRFGPGLDRADRRRAAAAAGGTLGAEVRGLGWARVSTGPGRAARVLAALRGRAGVAEVQPNYVRRIAATPNDPSAVEQTSIGATRLSSAWDVATGSPATKVAIVDTGVDLDHPDLAANVDPGHDFVNGDDQADDDNGHGTMVAGLAAASGNNGVGVTGASWRSRIIPVKVLNAQGEGDDATIAAGIAWAAEQGVDVINLSLGGPGMSAVLDDAIRSARAAGAVIVAAAGNDGAPFPMYPAAAPGVVAVTAADAGGDFASFSNSGSWVDAAAPGVNLLTTCRGTAYCRGTGTSFAAPLVSGAALLVRSLHPGWSPDQVETALRAGARDRGPRGIDPYFGAGLLDAYGALGGARQPRAVPPADAAEPNDTPARATPLSDTAAGSISHEGDVDWYAASLPGSGPMTVTVTPTAADPVGGSHLMVIEAFGPDLRFITGAISDSSGAATVVFQPPAPGTHRFAVRTLSGERAPYRIDVAPGGQIERFWPYETTPAGAWPEAVAIGDVTGDGLADVLATTSVSDGPRLLVFAQTPQGTLAEPIALPAYGGGRGRSIAVGDLDGDGLTDAAVAAQAGVQIHLQAGGGLADPVLLDGTAGASAIQAADMDGDGRLDLVYAGESGVALLRNEVAGFVREPIRSEAAGLLRIGDLTGDGRPDVVTVEYGKIVVTPGTGGGAFGAPAAFPTDLGWAFWGLDLGDVTGDGRADVIISQPRNRPEAAIVVFPQLADGTIGAGRRIPTWDIPEPVRAADVNGDGRTDVVTLHGGWRSAGVLLQRPDGGLDPEERAPFSSASHYRADGMAVGDVDDDGLPDVVAVDSNSDLVVLYQRPAGFPPGEKLWVEDAAPADSTGGAPALARPTVAFARALDPDTVSPETVTLTSADTGAEVPVSVGYSAAARTVTISPASPLRASGTYVVTIEGVTDVDGAALDWPVSTRFTVAPGPFAVTAGPLAPGADRRVTGVVARVSDLEDLGETGAYAAVIEWGDGRSSAGRVTLGGPGSAVVAGDHTYAAPGRHTVTVSVKSSDGRTGRASAAADVAAEGTGTSPETPPVGPEAPPVEPQAPPNTEAVPPPGPQPPRVRLTGLRATAPRVRSGGVAAFRLRLSGPAVVDVVVQIRGRIVKRLRTRMGGGPGAVRLPARIGRRPLAPGTYLVAFSAASADGPAATARTRVVVTPAGALARRPTRG